MVSIANRDQAWQLLYEANRMVRYWTLVHQRLLKRSRWHAIVLAVLAAGAGTALIAEMPSVIAVVANAGVIVFSIITLIRDTSGTLADVRAVRARCDGVAREARGLWARVRNERISDEVLEERWNDLKRDLDEATGSLADLPIVDDLNVQAAQAAKDLLTHDYASGQA